MGLSDTIVFDSGLPENVKSERFQIKAFENLMEEYYVRDNLLYREKAYYDHVPKNERPYPEGEGILEFCGSMRKIHEADVFFPWTGEIHFYAEKISGEDITMVALFFEGHLKKMLFENEYRELYKEWKKAGGIVLI